MARRQNTDEPEGDAGGQEHAHEPSTRCESCHVVLPAPPAAKK